MTRTRLSREVLFLRRVLLERGDALRDRVSQKRRLDEQIRKTHAWTPQQREALLAIIGKDTLFHRHQTKDERSLRHLCWKVEKALLSQLTHLRKPLTKNGPRRDVHELIDNIRIEMLTLARAAAGDLALYRAELERQAHALENEQLDEYLAALDSAETIRARAIQTIEKQKPRYQESMKMLERYREGRSLQRALAITDESDGAVLALAVAVGILGGSWLWLLAPFALIGRKVLAIDQALSEEEAIEETLPRRQ